MKLNELRYNQKEKVEEHHLVWVKLLQEDKKVKTHVQVEE